MFNSNPFAELSTSVPPAIMQTYVVVMAILVVVGTLFDVVHKKSAKYFFENMRASIALSSAAVTAPSSRASAARSTSS